MNALLRRSFARHALAAVAWLLLIAGLAQADSSAADDVQSRLDELERQIAAMQAANQSPTVISSAQPAVINDSYFDPVSIGWVVGAELTFLKPMASNGEVPGANSTIVRDIVNGSEIINEETSNPYGFESSPRFWFGYVGEGGAGIRARYWEFDHSAEGEWIFNDIFSGSFSSMPVFGNLECRTVDLEVTKQIDFSSWKLTPFAGCRYAGMSQALVVDSPGSLVTHGLNFYGVGPTGGVETYCSLFGFDDFGWFTNMRGSLLYGHHTHMDAQTFGFAPGRVDIDTVRSEGDLMGIVEISTGPQWKWPIDGGGDFFVRGAGEGQLWLNAGTAEFVGDQTDSLGFVGFSLSVGIER